MREGEVATGTAMWSRAGLPLVPIRWVIIRDPERPVESRTLLCPDHHADPAQIIGWCVWRWHVEITFHEGRAHRGVETQRQWSDVALLRTTPALLGLFSLVTIFAHQWLGEQPFPVRQAAWESKTLPTFSDTLALVRQRFWPVSSGQSHLKKPINRKATCEEVGKESFKNWRRRDGKRKHARS